MPSPATAPVGQVHVDLAPSATPAQYSIIVGSIEALATAVNERQITKEQISAAIEQYNSHMISKVRRPKSVPRKGRKGK